MKSFGTTCSVVYGTNRVVSSSQCHWGKVKTGGFFKFSGDNKHFTIIERKDFRWTKNFALKNKNTIIIEDNIFPNITKKDNLIITYKEYELENINVITDKGKKYKKDDLVYLNGGSLSNDLNTPVILKIVSINNHGGVEDCEVYNKGKYLSYPDEKEITTITNGDGENLKLNISFRELEKRGWVDREVFDIKYNAGQSIITILQPLPEGLPNGKLSIEKWELFLDSSYILRNENVVSEEYEITNDFIPNLEIPKLIRGQSNPDIIINYGFQKIGEKIKNLEDRIKQLENKI